jgi:FkbM family methyltransferase
VLLRTLVTSIRGLASQREAQHRASFAPALAELLEEKKNLREEDNFDYDRWHAGLEDALRQEAAIREQFSADLSSNSPFYEAIWQLLEDEASRDWLLQLSAYRLLGHRHVRLPTNTSEHWEVRAAVKALPSRPSEFSGFFGPLRLQEVEFEGEPITVEGRWSNVAWTFYFRQYYFARDGASIAPMPGDRVIDAGACYADTALGFAARVGHSGRIVSFEIDPANAAVAKRNLTHNPSLAQHIDFRECALADAETPLYLRGSGPGAQVTSEPGAQPLTVTTIDRLIESGDLDRVDFIKMDIEGAELTALMGAEESLRRFRPRLAISLYHRAGDYWRIPIWLHSLDLGYRFYLDHYTIHREETVLYAEAAA